MRRIGQWFLAVIAIQCAGTGAAGASVVSATPTLPLLNVPFVTGLGAGCFPAVSLCIAGGSLTLTSVVSSGFNASGQDIVANASYSGILTDLSSIPVGTISLTGTLEEEVVGRTTSTMTGSWVTDLLALSLSGPLLGHTLTLDLSPSPPSTGTTTITPISSDGPFAISSFFDVFVDLSLDTPTPLHTQRGPLHFEAQDVPEPAGIAILATGLFGLWRIRRSARVQAIECDGRQSAALA